MIEDTDIKLKFGYIISSQSITNLQMDMGEIIAKKGLNTSRQDCQKILDIYNISSVSDCKKELLELSLFYIKIALIDSVISEDEMTNIRFLKLLFDINEGDFKSDTQMSDEISRIIKNQVDLMILNDRKIDEEEALQKIFLQEIANAEIQKNNKLRFFCNSCFIYLFRFDCIKSIFIPKKFTPIQNLEDELLQKIMGL